MICCRITNSSHTTLMWREIVVSLFYGKTLSLLGLPKWHAGKESTCQCKRCWFDLLEQEMATCSSVLALEIPWTEEPDRLQTMGSQRARQDWAHTHPSLVIKRFYPLVTGLERRANKGSVLFSPSLVILITEPICICQAVMSTFLPILALY